MLTREEKEERGRIGEELEKKNKSVRKTWRKKVKSKRKLSNKRERKERTRKEN